MKIGEFGQTICRIFHFQLDVFPGKSTKERILMNHDEKHRFTMTDFLFGLTGSTIFVLALHFFTS
ncbi:hypothetical protein SLU01_00780 [Sporosarcina luteola]|uniref:Uncharacterized protein n=1 Tax=Sporosarcina luteola TaxID=582850 RepID=A0A511Z2X2_9BACL|nr:hypothetical protein SLU01_00780 [Sporosarcina luteola]